MNTHKSQFPLVTIITLAYNTGERIVNTLESIRLQSYPNIQHIIIDDASTDKTLEIINKWAAEINYSCLIIPHTVNQGICKSINEGIQKSEGKYIAVIGDDMMMEDKISDDVSFMEANPSFAFCHSKMIALDYQTKQENKLHSTGSDNLFHDFFAWKTLIQAPTVFYRKSIFDQVGLFDENLIFEDFDMFLRITYKYPVGFRDCFTVKYTINVNSIRKNKMNQMLDSSFEIMEKWSFLPNYKYYVGRRHLMYFYNFAAIDKKAALKHIPGSLRFMNSKKLYLSFFRLIFSW